MRIRTRDKHKPLIPFSARGGFFPSHDSNEDQDAFIRDCSSGRLKINGKSLSDCEDYIRLNEVERNSYVSLKPLLIALIKQELCKRNPALAETILDALNRHYSQNPVHTHVAEALQRVKDPLFVVQEETANVEIDTQGRIQLLTTFDINGFGTPTFEEGSGIDIEDRTGGIVTQTATLAWQESQCIGLRLESIHFDNPELEKLYLSAIEKNFAQRFHQLNVNARYLQELCNGLIWASNNFTGHLANTGKDILNYLAKLGADDNRFETFNSIIHYTINTINDSYAYDSNYTNHFIALKEKIARTKLAESEKAHLLSLLMELNNYQFSRECERFKNPLITNENASNEIRKTINSLNVLRSHIVATAQAIAKDGKPEDVIFQTKILHNTHALVEAAQNTHGISQPSRLNKLISEYESDAYALKQRPSKLSNILGETMTRFKGLVMVLLGSFSLGFAGLSAGFGAPRSLESCASAEQFAQSGHALLFKPLPKMSPEEKRAEALKDKQVSLSKTMQSFVSRI